MQEIQSALKTVWLGRHYDYNERLSSTQTICYELAEKGAPEGLVVCAGSQTDARGRGGSRWESPEGGLWFSLLLRPRCTPQDAMSLTVVTAVGICRGLMYYPGLRPEIKWPNDIWSDGCKLCGVLSEMKTQAASNGVEYAVIGCGLNLSASALSTEIREIASGIEDILGETVDKKELLARLLLGLESAYDQFYAGQKEELFREWSEYSLLKDKHIVVSTPNGDIRGRALDLSREGFLMLDIGNGRAARIISGTVKEIGD